MRRQTDRSGGPNRGGVLMTAMVAALGVGAMATYMSRNPEARTIPPEMRREETPAVRAAETPARVRPTTGQAEPRAPGNGGGNGGGVRLPQLKDDEVGLADKPTPTPTPVREIATAAVEVAKLEGVRLLGATIKDGTVTLDFNAALTEGAGSMQEGRFIDALTQGMRQIKGAERVRIFADGKPIETLGHLDWGEAISLKEGEEPQP